MTILRLKNKGVKDMQVVKGYLSNGSFTPVDNIILPNQIEAVLVFSEPILKSTETIDVNQNIIDKQANIDWLNSIKASIALSMDEDLTNFPKQEQMKTSYDDWIN